MLAIAFAVWCGKSTTMHCSPYSWNTNFVAQQNINMLQSFWHQQYTLDVLKL